MELYVMDVIVYGYWVVGDGSKHNHREAYPLKHSLFFADIHEQAASVILSWIRLNEVRH